MLKYFYIWLKIKHICFFPSLNATIKFSLITQMACICGFNDFSIGQWWSDVLQMPLYMLSSPINNALGLYSPRTFLILIPLFHFHAHVLEKAYYDLLDEAAATQDTLPFSVHTTHTFLCFLSWFLQTINLQPDPLFQKAWFAAVSKCLISSHQL
jgi:hypothetical protein